MHAYSRFAPLLKVAARALAALALVQCARSQSIPTYTVEKFRLFTQTSVNDPVPTFPDPYVFEVSAPVPASFSTPAGNSRTLTGSVPAGSYGFDQPFASQATMDFAFPSGTYTLTAAGQAPIAIPITGDLYPVVPQVTNGYWNSSGQLLIDPASNYTFTNNLFATFSSAGAFGTFEFLIQDATGANVVGFTQVSTTTAAPNLAALIPAGTLAPNLEYTGTLTYATAVTDDVTSSLGNELQSLYISSTTFTILTVPPPASAGPANGVAPIIAGDPASQTIASGSTVAFSLLASGMPSPTFQWYLNGAPIASGTRSLLVVNGATSADAGAYTCVATNPSGSVTSDAATLTVLSTANPGRLTNLSTRAVVGTGSNLLIAGFAVGGGTGSEPLLARASGPALTALGVTGVLADPQLQLFAGQDVLSTNNGWEGNPEIASEAASVGAFAWTMPSSHDSALATSLANGSYTAQVSGQSGDTGVALMELYDATPAGAHALSSPRLTNLSARAAVGTGANILIAGFAIGGDTARTVLIRASGPALVPLGVTGTLPDPKLVLLSGNAMLAENNAWGGDPQIAAAAASVGAFQWTNPASSDSALLITLPPGSYTAQVFGAAGDTGVALAEVYEVP